METIYFEIADFIIKLNFYPAEITYPKKKLVTEIKSYYKQFLTKTANRKEDFTINFSHTHGSILSKKGDSLISTICRYISNKEITTHYEISFFYFQRLVFTIIISLLTKKKILFLHASAAIASGKCDVFLGKPGAGKSTIIKLLKSRYKPFADDSIFLYKKNNVYYCHQTPFYEKNFINKRNISYPLGNIYILNKSSLYKISKIEKKEHLLDLIIQQAISMSLNNKAYLRLILSFIHKDDCFFNLFFGKSSKKVLFLLKPNKNTLIEH